MRAKHGARLLGTVGYVVAVALAGCDPAAAATQTRDTSQTYQVRISGIELNLDAGDITLSPNSGSGIVVKRRLHWRSLEPTINEDFIADTMVITGNCPHSDGCSVDYDVSVPAGSVVKAHTSSGDITVTDITGALDLSSQSGDLTVHSAQSRTTMSTDSGRISADRVRSTEVSATTKSGDVTLGFVAAPQTVTAETASGNVTVTVPAGGSYRVDADTDAGQRTVTVAVDVAATRHITARTQSGNVTVRSG